MGYADGHRDLRRGGPAAAASTAGFGWLAGQPRSPANCTHFAERLQTGKPAVQDAAAGIAWRGLGQDTAGRPHRGGDST